MNQMLNVCLVPSLRRDRQKTAPIFGRRGKKTKVKCKWNIEKQSQS
jgi:hypothetical protein